MKLSEFHNSCQISGNVLSPLPSMHHQEKLEHHVYKLTCHRAILFFYSLLNDPSFSVSFETQEAYGFFIWVAKFFYFSCTSVSQYLKLESYYLYDIHYTSLLMWMNFFDLDFNDFWVCYRENFAREIAILSINIYSLRFERSWIFHVELKKYL